MRLKKINAVLGLLSILLLLMHMGYTIWAYLTFTYNPTMKLAFAVPFMVVACLHAICGMLAVFTQADGTRLNLYRKLNRRTIVQRVTAALILPLLILHINTFTLMSVCVENGQTLLILLLIVAELAFFACVIAHVAVSLTSGLVTLGLLTSEKTRKVLDRIMYAVGALAFVGAAFVIIKVQAFMFLMG